jgi:hypothetical protein
MRIGEGVKRGRVQLRWINVARSYGGIDAKYVPSWHP